MNFPWTLDVKGLTIYEYKYLPLSTGWDSWAVVMNILSKKVYFYMTLIVIDMVTFMGKALSKQCPYDEFFWSVFSRIWTEYGDLLCKSPYSVRMRGKKN